MSTESVFLCDLNKIDASDLMMYIDLIEQKKSTADVKSKRRAKINNELIDEMYYSLDSDHTSDTQSCDQISDTNSYDGIQTTDTSSYCDFKVNDTYENKDEGIQCSSSASSISGEYSNVYELSQIVDQFDDIFSYFNEDVQVDDVVNTSTSQDTVKEMSNKFQCQVKDVVYKSRKQLKSIKKNNSGRLGNLINLFENIDIASGRKNQYTSKVLNLKCTSADTSMSMDEDSKNEQMTVDEPNIDDRNTPPVKLIIEKYQNKINNPDEGIQYASVEKPASPPPGEFEASRQNIDNFFKQKFSTDAESAAVANELCIVPDDLSSMFLKYNKFRTIKTFLETHEFMQKCHTACSSISENILIGLEHRITEQERNLYLYFKSLSVI